MISAASVSKSITEVLTSWCFKMILPTDSDWISEKSEHSKSLTHHTCNLSRACHINIFCFTNLRNTKEVANFLQKQLPSESTSAHKISDYFGLPTAEQKNTYGSLLLGQLDLNGKKCPRSVSCFSLVDFHYWTNWICLLLCQSQKLKELIKNW